MKIIGITGSIGCGKTYLANIIRSMGYCVYNPDDWTRELYRRKDFLKIIKGKFPEVFDAKDNFNKRKLRNIVFDDKNKLKELESFIHPFLVRKLKKTIHKYAIHSDILFLDVALLYEFGWDKYCDYVIVADVNKDIQKKRVMLRDNISENDFLKIISLQCTQQFKKDKADYVINTGLPETINRVQLIKFIEETKYERNMF